MHIMITVSYKMEIDYEERLWLRTVFIKILENLQKITGGDFSFSLERSYEGFCIAL